MPAHIQKMRARHLAQEARREADQGRGRPIISIEFKEQRLVAVANELFYGRWQTFEGFLMHYLHHSFGQEWAERELKNAPQDRHPLLSWLEMNREIRKRLPGEPGRVQAIPETGVSRALLSLAYNLYLLKHNSELKRRLVTRLRHSDQFHGAYYETQVAAWFILAGFKLTLLDEESGLTRSCEFEAAAPSGRVFSVEAKTRLPRKATHNVSNQLVDALRKDAAHDRVVFIDLNIPDAPSEALAIEVGDSIRSREPNLMIGGQPAPPAYVLVTNLPYHHDLRGNKIGLFVVAEGFKIPDFGTATFTSLAEQFQAEQRHADVLAVLKAFAKYRIPSTFDGELPEVAFGGVQRRWLLGDEYDLETLGLQEKGVLVSALVDSPQKKARLAFRLASGDVRVLSDDMSDGEMRAYRVHPESFFGAPIGQPHRAETPLDLFKFVYNSYKGTPREKLLEFLASAPDIASLMDLPDEQLLMEFCNRNALAMMQSGFTATNERGWHNGGIGGDFGMPREG